MVIEASPRLFLFNNGRVRVDVGARSLTVDSAQAKLGSRAFDLLEALIHRRDRLVPKQELVEIVWPRLVVEENNLHVHVASLRKFLGQDAIVTVAGRGYRLALTLDGQTGEAEGVRPLLPPAGAIGKPSMGLFGREALIASVCTLMRKRDVRLVTLTGTGGSGKTRVAQQVTVKLSADFADGSYTVLLAPVREPAFVIPAIITVLQIQDTGTRPAEQLLLSHLRDREVLLTLDNFEHVLSAAPLVERLLSTCPRVKLLVTSRAVLRLPAEQDVVVPPLALPSVTDNSKRALGSASVQLFAERALRAGRTLESNDDVLVAAQICRRLDGLPLALELAAARLKVLSPQALLVRLEHRLQVLKSSSTHLPERQRTLRHAIGWSYGLLNQEEQLSFRRLSVFAGGFCLEAAEAVAETPERILDVMESLTDQNLVQRLDDVAGDPRFSMLETIREFAIDELERSGEMLATRHKHAAFFVEFVTLHEDALTRSGRKPVLLRFDAETNNLRAALHFLLEQSSDVQSGLRLAAALPWFWYFAGQYAEGRRWLAMALQRGSAEAEPALLAKALTGAARLAMYSAHVGRGIEYAQQSVELWRRVGDQRGLAYALFHLGLAMAMRTGQPHPGFSFMEQSLAAFSAIGDKWGVALAKSYCGVLSTFDTGQEERSKELLEHGRALFTALGDEWGASTALHYLRTIAMRQGDYAQARAYSDEVMRAARDAGDSYRISRNLHGLAEIAMAERKYAESIAHLKESLSITREQGRIGDSAKQLRLLARLELLDGRPDHTVRLLACASTLTSEDSTMPPDDPSLAEKALAEAKTQIGPSRYEHEWSMGLAMSWDQAISWALAV